MGILLESKCYNKVNGRINEFQPFYGLMQDTRSVRIRFGTEKCTK